jgi:hypothetical protein
MLCGKQLVYHVKRMSTFAHQQSTVITGEFARGTSAIELDATDATDLIFRHVPAPGGDRVPFLDCYFHPR